jgi:diguanylate cyclase (GGDEF)-like protein
MSLAGAKVLLVEDDVEVLDFLKFILEQEKYQVVTAVNGQEGLDFARAERPDIILLDVILPVIHGYEVCEQLRQDPSTCLIPIIMVTSLTAVKDRLTGIKLGADEYVAKPFEPVELLARVERLITRTRQNLASNPLSGLPGSVSFEQEISRRLKGNAPFTLGMADVNGLTIYNEAYGYEKGDSVIRLVGTILRSAVTELGNRSDLPVHLGGDTFGFVSTPVRANVISSRILENMEYLVPMQYDEETRARGHIIVKNKEGTELKREFLTMAIGLVDAAPGLYQHHAQIIDRARKALAEAKKKEGNHFFKMS